MGNILTDLIPDLYDNLDVVSRELVGFIPSVARNSKAERAAKDEAIIVPVSNISTGVDVTPSMTPPDGSDMVMDNEVIKITKLRAHQFYLTGEEYKGLNNGVGANTILGQNFQQALRALTNEMESDIALAIAESGSRAYGTAGTTPFGSDLSDGAKVRKILDDNGAPMDGRSMVFDTNVGVNLRSLSQLTNVNEAGDKMTLRQGELGNLFGFGVKESAQVATPAIGTATGMVINDDAYAVGATTLTLKTVTGAGTVKAGDIITIAGDVNKYIAAEDVATSGAGTEVKIAKPGLRVAIGATSNKAVTIGAIATKNAAFTSNAIQLVTRAPALPFETDLAVDNEMMVDPRSGMAFEVRVYKGYKRVMMEVSAAWGVKVIKPEHVVALLG